MAKKQLAAQVVLEEVQVAAAAAAGQVAERLVHVVLAKSAEAYGQLGGRSTR